MIRFYSPILLLQMFCLYTAYQRKEEQKWFWIIAVLPFIGSLFYLHHVYYSRENIENITEGVKESFIENYKIDKIEKNLNFSDTVANKIKLGDEYFQKKDYHKSRLLFESCLQGSYENDPSLLTRLLNISYQERNYSDVIKYGDQIKNEKTFNTSEGKVALAWSYFNLGKFEEAKKTFEEMDIRFSNYPQRLQFAKFLNDQGQSDLALQKLGKLIAEIDSMDSFEKKSKRKIFRSIKGFQAELNNQ